MTNKQQKNLLCVDDLRHAEYYRMQTTFDDLYSKSKNEEKFQNLMPLILSRENILLAYRNIKSNGGSKTQGTDNVVIDDIGKLSADEYVEKLRFIVAGSKHGYRPKAVRRKEIPKPNGKLRPLGIPCMWDRLVQQCIKQVMEPICEAKFSENSYGFRPLRSVEHAIQRVYQLMQRANLYYNGRTCGTLVPMPKDYFVLPDPGKWWNPDDVVTEDTDNRGTVSGVVKNKVGAPINAASVKLVSMDGENIFQVKTDRKGIFRFNDVPVGGYDLFILEDDGTQVNYQASLWLEQKGDKVDISLTYAGNGINVQEMVVHGGAIYGHIVDKKGAPMEGITVLLEDETSIVTDSDGYFRFDSVEAGVHSIYIQGKDGKLKIADIMINEGIAYQLTAADGSPLMYDPEGGTVSDSLTKQDTVKKPKEKSNSNVGMVIAIFAAVVVLAAAAVFVLVFAKKKKKHTI